MRRTLVPDERQNPSQGLPLFGGSTFQHASTQSTKVDPDERLAWARRALMLSDLTTYTAEDVRRLTLKMRPHYMESGCWIGGVFRSPLFTMIDHERAKRGKAKARYIIRYQLSEQGEAERRNAQGVS